MSDHTSSKPCAVRVCLQLLFLVLDMTSSSQGLIIPFLVGVYMTMHHFQLLGGGGVHGTWGSLGTIEILSACKHVSAPDSFS